jgi:hypothetical protein
MVELFASLPVLSQCSAQQGPYCYKGIYSLQLTLFSQYCYFSLYGKLKILFTRWWMKEKKKDVDEDEHDGDD